MFKLFVSSATKAVSKSVWRADRYGLFISYKLSNSTVLLIADRGVTKAAQEVTSGFRKAQLIQFFDKDKKGQKRFFQRIMFFFYSVELSNFHFKAALFTFRNFLSEHVFEFVQT